MMDRLYLFLIALSDSGPDERPFDGDDFTSKIFPNGIIDFAVQLLGFVVLLVLVYFIAYKPVHKLLTKRREYIEANIKESESKLAEAKEAALRKDELIKQGQEQADKIVEDARKQAQSETASSLAAAEEAIEKKKQAADEDIALQAEKAKKQLKGEVVDMAISASSALLSREVDGDDERKLLDDFLAKLEEK